MLPCVSWNCESVIQSYTPLNEKCTFVTFCKVEWANKAKIVMFSVNTICVDIELLLMRNHTEVNALLLRKRLDMLKRHNGGQGRRRL